MLGAERGFLGGLPPSGLAMDQRQKTRAVDRHLGIEAEEVEDGGHDGGQLHPALHNPALGYRSLGTQDHQRNTQHAVPHGAVLEPSVLQELLTVV